MTCRPRLALWLCLSLLAVAAWAQEPVPVVAPDDPAQGREFGNGREFPGAKGELATDRAVLRGGKPTLRLLDHLVLRLRCTRRALHTARGLADGTGTHPLGLGPHVGRRRLGLLGVLRGQRGRQPLPCLVGRAHPVPVALQAGGQLPRAGHLRSGPRRAGTDQLTLASGVWPHPHGPIEVAWAQGSQVIITVPAGVEVVTD